MPAFALKPVAQVNEPGRVGGLREREDHAPVAKKRIRRALTRSCFRRHTAHSHRQPQPGPELARADDPEVATSRSPSPGLGPPRPDRWRWWRGREPKGGLLFSRDSDLFSRNACPRPCRANVGLRLRAPSPNRGSPFQAWTNRNPPKPLCGRAGAAYSLDELDFASAAP